MIFVYNTEMLCIVGRRWNTCSRVIKLGGVLHGLLVFGVIWGCLRDVYDFVPIRGKDRFLTHLNSFREKGKKTSEET